MDMDDRTDPERRLKLLKKLTSTLKNREHAAIVCKVLQELKVDGSSKVEAICKAWQGCLKECRHRIGETVSSFQAIVPSLGLASNAPLSMPSRKESERITSVVDRKASAEGQKTEIS